MGTQIVRLQRKIDAAVARAAAQHMKKLQSRDMTEQKVRHVLSSLSKSLSQIAKLYIDQILDASRKIEKLSHNGEDPSSHMSIEEGKVVDYFRRRGDAQSAGVELLTSNITDAMKRIAKISDPFIIQVTLRPDDWFIMFGANPIEFQRPDGWRDGGWNTDPYRNTIFSAKVMVNYKYT